MTRGQCPFEAEALRRLRWLPAPWSLGLASAVAFGLCALCLLLKPYADHLALIHRLEQNGAIVWCDRGQPEWLRRWLGDRLGRAMDPIYLVGMYRPARNADATRDTFQAINGLTSIRILSLDLTDNELRELDCPDLRSLDLYSSASEEGLRELIRFPELVAVGLTESQVTDAGLAHLSSIPYLQTVRLQHCDGISDRGIERLAETTPLLWFEIEDCPDIGDTALTAVATSNRLQILRIASCNRVTDEGVSALAGSPVRRLEISNCIGIRGPGLAELKHCPSLVQLRLLGNVYGDEHAAYLHQFGHPMNIEFVGSRVTPGTRRELETSLPYCSVELSRR